MIVMQLIHHHLVAVQLNFFQNNFNIFIFKNVDIQLSKLIKHFPLYSDVYEQEQ